MSACVYARPHGHRHACACGLTRTRRAAALTCVCARVPAHECKAFWFQGGREAKGGMVTYILGT
jgi:hypothetical protein